MKFNKLASLFIVPLFFVLSCATALAVGVSPTFATPSVNDMCSNTSIPAEVRAASGCSEAETGVALASLPDVIQGIVNGVIAFAGTVAVAFIVVGGINYMTSAGDANKVTKARNTIMYACIGLAICALSFIIVNFVIVDLIAGGNTTDVGDGTGVDTVGDSLDHNLPELIQGIANGVISVLGTACVIVMIVGGFNYMSSAGDANKVAKAKNTLLYGAIGLVICVLAFAIVNFVIRNLIHGDAPEGVAAHSSLVLDADLSPTATSSVYIPPKIS